MADRHIAFLFVMAHEDVTMSGVVATDNDGGQVRFGVNSKSNPQAVGDGFYTMPVTDALVYAEKLFVAKYWSAVMGNDIAVQRIANQVADLYFLSEREAILILQRAVNRFVATPISVDGAMGPVTLATVNVVADPLSLLDAIKAQAIVFYQSLVKKDPVKYTTQDYKSWVSRLNA